MTSFLSYSLSTSTSPPLSSPLLKLETNPFKIDNTTTKGSSMSGATMTPMNAAITPSNHPPTLPTPSSSTTNSHKKTKNPYALNIRDVGIPMLCWFATSTSLSLYNRALFADDSHVSSNPQKSLFSRFPSRFPCPLLMTGFHFLLQWFVSYLIIRFYYKSHTPNTSPSPGNPSYFSTHNLHHYFYTTFPLALFSSLDIGLSNLSLKYLPLTSYTMIKSSSPLFCLAFTKMLITKTSASVARNASSSLKIFTIVVLITVGEFLTVSKTEYFFSSHASSSELNAGNKPLRVTGLILCLTAACISGLRWTLLQIEITRNQAYKSKQSVANFHSVNNNPTSASTSTPTSTPTIVGYKGRSVPTTLSTLLKISPTMSLILITLSLLAENPLHNLSPSNPLTAVGATLNENGVNPFTGSVTKICVLAIATAVGASLALLMILSEFTLLSRSSAIVLMICGIAKELLTVMSAMVFLEEKMTATNWIGALSVVLGVAGFKVFNGGGGGGHSDADDNVFENGEVGQVYNDSDLDSDLDSDECDTKGQMKMEMVGFLQRP